MNNAMRHSMLQSRPSFLPMLPPPRLPAGGKLSRLHRP
jgi:hypothetical protein